MLLGCSTCAASLIYHHDRYHLRHVPLRLTLHVDLSQGVVGGRTVANVGIATVGMISAVLVAWDAIHPVFEVSH